MKTALTTLSVLALIVLGYRYRMRRDVEECEANEDPALWIGSKR